MSSCELMAMLSRPSPLNGADRRPFRWLVMPHIAHELLAGYCEQCFWIGVGN